MHSDNGFAIIRRTMRRKMSILLTNDDGIQAPGILAMYRALCRLGDVIVVAPDGERSSQSQAITLNHPIYHRQTFFCAGIKGHALSGTPADCVKFALAIVLKEKPDLIVSGINRGSNDGCSVFYSGTVGAAREGSLSGIPSIAVSLDGWEDPDFTIPSQVGAKVARWVLKNGLPHGTFLNVNAPEKNLKGLRWAEQCRSPIHGEFVKRKDPNNRDYYWLTGRPSALKDEKTSDSYLLNRGYATVAPIHGDATDHTFLKGIPSQW